MNFSAYYTLRCIFLIIILHFSATVLSAFSSFSFRYEVCSCHPDMPVMTRSKAKLSCPSINEGTSFTTTSTFSINEHDGSIHELPSSDTTSFASIHVPKSTNLSSSITPFTDNLMLPVDEGPLPLSSEFSNSGDTPDSISKFQISKFPHVSSPVLHSCHTFMDCKLFIMAEDCDDLKPTIPGNVQMQDIHKSFASLSAQMTSQTTTLQHKLSMDFSQAIQAHDMFKQEVRTELD
jgi:hypothetical protein